MKYLWMRWLVCRIYCHSRKTPSFRVFKMMATLLIIASWALCQLKTRHYFQLTKVNYLLHFFKRRSVVKFCWAAMKSRDCLQSTTIFSAVVSSRFVGLKIFKYNFHNPRQASPFLTIPSRSWFIFHILLFSYLNEIIFCGFHHAKSNYA